MGWKRKEEIKDFLNFFDKKNTKYHIDIKINISSQWDSSSFLYYYLQVMIS